jgi:hypothetical protein
MRVLGLPLLLAACSFDSNTGSPSGPSSVGDGSSTGVTSLATNVGSDGSTIGSSGGQAFDLPPVDPGSESSSPAGSSSGDIDCDGGGVIVGDFGAEDLEHPMLSARAPMPIGAYAYSEAANAGLVTFAIDVPCKGEYALWALVYDEDTEPFVDGGNADSFLVRVDTESIFEWSYGCTTLYQVDPWSYERVQVASVLDCAAPEPLVFELAAGSHTIAFRNVEPGEHEDADPGSVAAIARVALTNVEGYTPDPDLD